MSNHLNAQLNAWVSGTQGCGFARYAAKALTVSLPRTGEGVLYRFPVVGGPFVAAPVEGYTCSVFTL